MINKQFKFEGKIPKGYTEVLKKLKPKFWRFQGQFESRSPVFKLVQDLYVINTWFKFENKNSKHLKS